MGAIAVITARGGSKRIPRKNVRDFCGKPMIAWTIETALASRLFGDVIVSTDDEEIADVARGAGALVPFIRPAELADDQSGTLPVMTHAVRRARDDGHQFDSACCLYGTAVFTWAEDLEAARALQSTGNWDYVFAAGRFARAPQRAFVQQADGAMALLQPEFALTRSQDLEATFFDAGQFYWGSARTWLDERPIFGPRTAFIELPPERAVDIDTPEDWAMAERQFEHRKRRDGPV